MQADDSRRGGRAGGRQGGSWLRSPQLTCSQLLNSSAMASSLINWGKWIFGSLRWTLASLYPRLPCPHTTPAVRADSEDRIVVREKSSP